MTPRPSRQPIERSGAYSRFVSSMIIDFDAWHDGTGYDLGALDEMTEAERADVKAMLLARSPREWRDFEALKYLGGHDAEAAVRDDVDHPNQRTRSDAGRFLDPDDPKRAKALARALGESKPFFGLAPVLDQTATFHPPEVIDALLRGAATSNDSVIAVNFAAMLYYIHGKAAEPFDWAHRPFFLRFGEGGAEREAAFRDLCRDIGVDPNPFLSPPKPTS